MKTCIGVYFFPGHSVLLLLLLQNWLLACHIAAGNLHETSAYYNKNINTHTHGGLKALSQGFERGQSACQVSGSRGEVP